MPDVRFPTLFARALRSGKDNLYIEYHNMMENVKLKIPDIVLDRVTIPIPFMGTLPQDGRTLSGYLYLILAG